MVSVPDIQLTPTNPDLLKEIESGTDGEFNTNDPDGSEGNGRLDPGERLNLDLLSQYADVVTDRQLGVYLSYGRTQVFHPDLSVGGSAKYVRKSVQEFSAWGLGLDLAALYQIRPEWAVAMNLQDITTTFLDWSFPADYTGGRDVAVSGGREYITPTVKIGTAWKQPIERISGSITVALDLDVRFEDEEGASFKLGSAPADVRAGIEYWYRDTLAFRVGSERLGGDSDPFTAGAGIRVKRFSFERRGAVLGTGHGSSSAAIDPPTTPS
jgi:hypothetical protein